MGTRIEIKFADLLQEGQMQFPIVIAIPHGANRLIGNKE